MPLCDCMTISMYSLFKECLKHIVQNIIILRLKGISMKERRKTLSVHEANGFQHFLSPLI